MEIKKAYVGMAAVIVDIALEWRPHKYPFMFFWGLNYDETIAALQKLPDDSPAQEVDRILRNDCWTTVHCEECSRKVREYVEMDCCEHRDTGSGGMKYCFDCVKAAAKLVQEHEGA